MKQGEVVTKTKLHREYWYGVPVELTRLGYVDRVPEKKKGEVTRYKVEKDLPSRDDLTKEVNSKLHTRSVEAWYEDAKSELESLRDEMSEWHGSMECNEGLQATVKYTQVQEAADALEGDLPDEIPESIVGSLLFLPPSTFPVACGYRSKRPRTGRDSRCGEVCCVLEAVKDRAQEEVNNLSCTVDDDDASEEERQEAEEQVSTLEEFISEVESISGEIEGIEFPGLYG